MKKGSIHLFYNTIGKLSFSLSNQLAADLVFCDHLIADVLLGWKD